MIYVTLFTLRYKWWKFRYVKFGSKVKDFLISIVICRRPFCVRGWLVSLHWRCASRRWLTLPVTEAVWDTVTLTEEGESESVGHSAVPDSLQPPGLQPTRLLHPGDFPGKNTGEGSHFLLQGIFLTQWSNAGLLRCRRLYHLSHQERPEEGRRAKGPDS